MGIEPVTRKEMFMAAAAGESVATLTPVTREEYFLSKIAGSGGGGGGGSSDSGKFIVTVYNANAQGTILKADKTHDEISSAIESGMSVVLNYKRKINSSAYNVFYLSSIKDGYYSFFKVGFNVGDFYCYSIGIYEENGEMVIDNYKGKLQIAP